MLTVRESPAAQDAADDACERWARAEDAWEAVKWALSRDPYIGTPLTEGGQARAFTLQGRWAWEMPTITVLYRIETPYVTIESAQFDDAQTGSIGNA